MIPNTLLRKWGEEEVGTRLFLERKLLEDLERGARNRIAMQHRAAIDECVLVLRGCLALQETLDRGEIEFVVAKQRLDERFLLHQKRVELDEIHDQLLAAHTRLSNAQELRKRRQFECRQTLDAEVKRWEEERRWMLRQLDFAHQHQEPQPPEQQRQQNEANGDTKKRTAAHWSVAMSMQNDPSAAAVATRGGESHDPTAQRRTDNDHNCSADESTITAALLQDEWLSLAARTQAALARARDVMAEASA